MKVVFDGDKCREENLAVEWERVTEGAKLDG